MVLYDDSQKIQSFEITPTIWEECEILPTIHASFLFQIFFLCCVFFLSCFRIINKVTPQLPVGLIAQLVEHCTSIAEFTGWNPIQAWIFLRL